MKFQLFRRNERRTVVKALLAAAIVAGGLGLAFVGLGGVDVAASDPHSWLTYNILHFAFNRSVAARASGIAPPADLDTPSRVALGAQQFHVECSNCHGGPGIGQSPIALSMTPRPQSLPAVVGQFSDPELFWIVKHGVKFSAMPAWPTQTRDDEVWSMVAFLKQLPAMSPKAYLEAVAPRPDPAGRPVLGLQAPIVLRDADTRRNSYPRDEFLYASPAVAFGDQGASLDPIAMCGRCHGDDGKGGATHGEAPDLTLQSADYLRASLEAYANGQRKSGYMIPVAAQLSSEQINALATYFASLRAPSHVADDVSSPDPRGEDIALHGISRLAVPACAFCHESSLSVHLKAPAISGQQAIFLRRQLTAMRDGDRGGNGHWNPMQAVASALSDADIAAVAGFYAARPAASPRAGEVDRIAQSGDTDAGEKLFGTVCATCHTKNAGGDAQGDFPNLTVQTPEYIRQALRQYRAGVRGNVKMKLATETLDDATILSLARYISSLPIPSPSVEIDPEAIRRGRAIASDGISKAGLPACLSCHDAGTTAALPIVARLQGQNPLYLEGKLDAFAHLAPEDVTGLNPMPAIARLLTKAEMQDLSAYFAAEPALGKPN